MSVFLQDAARPVPEGVLLPRHVYALSIVLTFVGGVTAALTYFLPGVLTGPAVTNGNARGTALVMFALATPALMFSMWWDRQGSWRAPFLWLGSLFYLGYNAFLLLFLTPFNSLFLLYVATESLALFSIFTLVTAGRGTPNETHVNRIPVRGLAALVWTIVALNLLAWLQVVVPAVFSDDPMSFLDGLGVATNAIYVQDLVVWLPLMTLAGWWMWNRRPLGVLLTGSWLAFGVLEGIGIAVDQWFGHQADPGSPHASVEVIPLVVGLAIVNLIGLSFYLRTPTTGSGMSRWHRRLPPSAFVLVTLLLVPAPAQAAGDDAFETLLEAELPGLLAEYGVSGSVVSSIVNGAVVWTNAYGLADTETGKGMNTEMVFEFGSCGKIVTAWATMKLVERGDIDLDTPANEYLDRMQIQSDLYDPSGVTVRRLLSHTSGLGIHGYVDFSPRRANPPNLVDSLQGAHLLEGIVETLAPGGVSFGRIELVQQPGSGYRYSGAGYGVLQVLIEDVTGEPFDAFVQREITDPLGATSLRWEWTPELQAISPTPYGEEGQTMEHRQLTIHGIGSEIGTVEDFAQFVAATVAGPDGDPPGRGVLAPETIDVMTTPLQEADFTQGLGYPLGSLDGNRSVFHSGRNMGWEAFFILDTVTGNGIVVASPSNRAGPLHSAITNLYFDTAYGPGNRIIPTPLPGLEIFSWLSLAFSLVLVLVLLVSLVRLVREVRSGRRVRAHSPSRRGVLRAGPWVLALLFVWYTLYSPLTLYLPAWYPDLWPTTGSAVLMVVLVGGVAFRVATAFLPRSERTVEGEGTSDGGDAPPAAVSAGRSGSAVSSVAPS